MSLSPQSLSPQPVTPQPLSPQRAANLAENPHAGQGAVVLDIGDGRGAVLAHLSPADEGAEIEIEPLDVPGLEGELDLGHGHGQGHSHAHTHAHDDGHEHPHTHRPHVAVVGRPTPSGEVVYSAVFPSLPAGTYRLHEPDSGQSRDVTVLDSSVTELVWSDPTA